MKVIKINKWVNKLLWIITILLFFVNIAFASPATSKKSITVLPTQAINFGGFCVNGVGGGTITIGWDGFRTSTGSVVLLPTGPMAQPAIFDLKPCGGRNIFLDYTPTTVLTGSNGGSLILEIGPSEKGMRGSSWTIDGDCNFTSQLRVGGTLHIPANAVMGNYSGNFEITVNQE
jgi:hypothetical protein